MEQDEIINALDCWINNFDGKATDFVTLCDALSLIKELTNENEKLKIENAGFEAATKQIINRLKVEIPRGVFSIVEELLLTRVKVENNFAENIGNDISDEWWKRWGYLHAKEVCETLIIDLKLLETKYMEGGE